MKLRQLFEAPGRRAAFALGRMNPATVGHELLVNAVKEAPGDSFLFLTDRPAQMPKDPLGPEEKLDWARKSFNGIAIGLAKTVLTAADRLYKMGYTDITFLEGERKLYDLLVKYNGVEKPTHNFKFDNIDYVQLERNAAADDATGMSGTKLRSYVEANDFEKFKAGVTDLAKPYADEMFKRLQTAMGIQPTTESISEAETSNPFPPQIDPPPVPTFPQMPQAGDTATDANGTTIGKTNDGGVYLSDGSGKYVWDAQGNPSTYESPQFTGLKITTDMKSGDVTVRYTEGGLDVSAVYDKSGKIKQGAEQVSYDFGAAKVQTGPQGNTVTVRGGSPAQDQTVQVGTESIEEANYGRYWCSTDKKWKTRKGPKQSRSS